MSEIETQSKLGGRFLIEEIGTNYLDGRKVFYPNNGCVGPVSFEVGTDILIILFDSQWILHDKEKPGENESCATASSK